jgi:hypothetical protein
MAFKDRFEKKDYALTEETMRKAGDLGFLSVAVPEAFRNGNGFVNTVLVCDYILEQQGSFSTALEHIRNWYYANYIIRN